MLLSPGIVDKKKMSCNCVLPILRYEVETSPYYFETIYQPPQYFKCDHLTIQEMQQKFKSHLKYKYKFKYQAKIDLTPGWVYAIGARYNTDKFPIKIGMTCKDIKSRLSALQIGSPVILKVIDSIYVENPNTIESSLHGYFNKFHSHGEWFNIDEKMINSKFLLIRAQPTLFELKRKLKLRKLCLNN